VEAGDIQLIEHRRWQEAAPAALARSHEHLRLITMSSARSVAVSNIWVSAIASSGHTSAQRPQ
jgi:hypothetical protein